MVDRLHFVWQFITVSCTCSESNSSTRKICMPMDCLVKAHTLASASVCRACRRNKSNADVRWCNEQLTCQGCARGFVTANKFRKAVQDSQAVFFYSILDYELAALDEREGSAAQEVRESGYSIKGAKKERNDATANHETKNTRWCLSIDRS